MNWHRRGALILALAAGLAGFPLAAQLTTLGSQVWREGDPAIAGDHLPGDALGEAMAAGDFNCDGFDDLAVGMPHEDTAGQANAGAVHIFYGGPAGLASGGADEILTEADTPDDDPEVNDHFGWSVAAYLSGDCGPRLAVGAPDEDFSLFTDAGKVFLFRFKQSDDNFVYRATLTESDINLLEDGSDDQFGFAMAAIDLADLGSCLEGSASAGLAVGAPGDTSSRGAVFVFRGNGCYSGPVEWESELCNASPTASHCAIFRQGDNGLSDSAEDDDRFGESLGGRAKDRLIIGVPGENGGAGRVHAVYNDDPPFDEIYYQDVLDHGASEANDHFGAALAEGDFDGDGDVDLAIGVPGEDVTDNSVAAGGAVQVIRALTDTNLSHTGDELYTQNNFDTAEDLDRFGSSLAAGDFGGGDEEDLAIGVPHEDSGSTLDVGRLHVMYGSATGLSLTGSQTFSQNSGSILESSEECDLWGFALAAGNFDGALGADLAIGAPGEDGACAASPPGAPPPSGNEGAVTVLYGALPGGFLSQITVSGPASVSEGAGQAAMIVHRTGSAVIPGAIHYHAAAGTATLNGDFSATLGDLDWPVGDKGDKTVNIPLVDDPNDEPTETLTFELDSPALAVQLIDDSTALSILDNDVFTGFADDFETSATAAWTSSQVTAISSIQQSTFARYAGEFGQRLQLGNTSPIFVRDELPFSAAYHARVYARLYKLFMDPGETFTLFQAHTPSGSDVFRLQVLALAGGVRALLPIGYTDGGTPVSGPPILFPPGMHAIEIFWQAAPSQLTPVGVFALLIDGKTEFVVSGLDNDGLRVDRVELGAPDGFASGTLGELSLDEFASSPSAGLNQISAFVDVAKADALWSYIHSMYNFEVTSACATNPLRFCANDAVTREELALFLNRAGNGPNTIYDPCTGNEFPDVLQNNAYCPAVKRLKDNGITSGCGGGNFCPKNPVRRGDLAVLIVRARDGGAVVPPPCGAKPFTDVETSDLRCPFIQALKADGTTNGCGGGNFCPDHPIRRQELAILLQRAFDYRLPLFP